MVRILSPVVLTLAALSLGPSFAHVLEAPPRLAIWPPELWREATVFHGQFQLFAIIGGPLDVGAILGTALLAYALRHERPSFQLALAGCLLFASSLGVWFAWVAPANSVLATWAPGPIPEDFHAIRNRWETGHMAVAGLKLLGFLATALAVTSVRKGSLP
jgi:ABC-type xylose transport system permease subunit